MTAAVELVYAILSLLAFAAVATVVGLRLAGHANPSALAAYHRIGSAVELQAPALAFGVALLATLGSLYFSEIARFEPCQLCWYQRIAMYPLVVLLGIAALRHEYAIDLYGRVIALIGAAISTYHVLVEWAAIGGGVCSVGVPCSVVWFRIFGFVSLPTMALAAFLLIATILSVRGPADAEPQA